MRKIFAVTFGLIGLLLSSFVILSIVHVTVCHHTGSQSNPYVAIDVSVHSVDDARGLNGHGDHVEDAWMSFIFDGVTYPGQNEGLFGTIIDNSCNLIIPPTNTPIPTNTDIPSATPSPTETETNTPTATPSFTPTDTDTPSATSTKEPFPTPTGTLMPTNTPTSTNEPTSTPTDEPTSTPTNEPTFITTVNPTSTPTLTETPRPPVPAEANSLNEYKGKLLGTVFMDGNSYELYQGVNAPNGTLALPSNKRGAALFDNTIWVHRAWNSGWLNLNIGDIVIVLRDSKFTYYKITNSEYLPYGIYPPADNFYIATCMSTDGVSWTNVQLFTLSLVTPRVK